VKGKLMKSLRILVFAGLLMLASVIASAQELTETTTIGSITVQHPANFTAEAVSGAGVGLIDDTDSFAILVFTESALSEMGMPEAATATDFLNALTGLDAVTGDPSPISLAGAEGFVVEGVIPDIGTNGLIYALDGENGLIVGLVIAREGDVTEEFRELGENIIDSVVIDPSAVVETDVPAATEEPEETPDEPTDEPTGEDEDCPISVDDLPENTVVFCLGAQMTYPEAWSLSEGTEEVDTFASINRENFAVSLSTSVNEVSQYYNPEIYATDVLKFTADIAGHETFDPAEHLTTVLEEDGRKVEVYNPADFVELTEDDVYQVTYIVTLNNDIFVTHTFTWVPSLLEDAESIDAEIEEIALSTVVTEDYEGTPAFIEVDGEMVFVFEATAFDSTYSFTYSDEDGTFVVTCPAEMSGEESTVWGTDIYTDDSSVCLAAAHAGVITLADGGTVQVTMLPGEESYQGTERNGVTTSDYGQWGGSFSVEAFELPESAE
jgi:hypothetical protein